MVSGKIGAGISAGSHLETGVPPAAEQGVPRGANCIVYKVAGGNTTILSCKDHYDDK